MENIAEAFQLFLSFSNIAAIVLGVVFGVVVGAIPGLTGTMAVALALPFTFALESVTAILLLVGIYKGSIYGGSIPAVLIKTPGTPSASCTVLDGYPLVQQGKAGKALYMSLYASCIADLISSLALIFLTGYIANFALSFGPPEFFTLICFSLTIIAGVSGDSLLKGFIAAFLGLLLATVGMDLVYGTNRFVFGSVDLMGGLSFIPVLIGLFALPEMIRALRQNLNNAPPAPVGDRVTWAELRSCFKTIVRGSFIGIILGAIPGIGAAPAAFMSYSEAKRSSKNPELFGKGALEGVAAAEAGNNGVCGAAMIPLLSLGVPGDVITGVILGAFMLHGLTPGPLLFQDNIVTVYAIYIGILVSSVALFFAGQLAIKAFSGIAKIPHKLLFPIVIIICFYGAYAVNNQLFDVLIMIGMGIVGYGMLILNFPAAPFLIAFILGPLYEDNLRRSLVLSEGSLDIFFRSGICWFFIVLTVISLLLIIKRNIQKKGV